MEHYPAGERTWSPTPVEGIERSLFRNHDNGGRASVVRLRTGTRFPPHRHQRTEEVIVLEGEVSIGGIAMRAGDYLFTGPDEVHDVCALTDAIIFVSSQGPTPFVEDAP